MLVAVGLAVSAGVVAGVVILAGSGGGSGSAGPAPVESKLFVVGANDSRQPLENGGTVDVGALSLLIRFSDFPGKVKSGMEIAVTDKATGAPVKGANLVVLPTMPMPEMFKGFMHLQGIESAPGRFDLNWQLPMPSWWTLFVEVTSAGSTSSTELFVSLS